MKTIMKTWIITFLCFFGMQTVAMADTDKPISVNQLPAAAQQVLTKHFSDKKVALAKKETGIFDLSYDVIFTNGDKVEFDRSGNWTEIDCKYTAVPAALIPSAIAKHVKENYPDKKIVQIEKDRKNYDVELSGGLELTFNHKFQVIDIDN